MKGFLKDNSGFTLMELMVSVSIGAGLMLGIVSGYRSVVAISYDHKVRTVTRLQAEAIMQTIGVELRTLGNGVPFDQPNFQIGESTLSDPTVTHPILTATADTDYISFRLNESGEVHLLTADFDPASDNTISLTGTNGLEVGDTIYLNNSVVAEDDGYVAEVTAINTSTNVITVDTSSDVYSPSATFKMGTLCENVSLVTYESFADWSGITRDAGNGSVVMAPNSTMTLTYLDENGSAITLPLTPDCPSPPCTDSLTDNLRSIQVSVSVRSSSNLSDGSTYTATMTQTFGIRNLGLLL